MMKPTGAAVFDPLTLGEKLSVEFLGGIYPIVGAATFHKDANGGGFVLKLKLGLDSFGSSKPNLVNNRDFPASSVTEQGPSSKLLRWERVATSSELMAFEARFLLIREDKVTWFQLVQL
jgi:hypothetical protein